MDLQKGFQVALQKRAFLMALQKCFQVEEESWKETEWQPKKKYERMSGSQKERNRLAAIERVQGKASGYERQVQRLSAIGEARFKRMQVRKGRSDQGAPSNPKKDVQNAHEVASGWSEEWQDWQDQAYWMQKQQEM